MGSGGNWQRAAAQVVREAADAVGRDRLRELSRKSGPRHVVMTADDERYQTAG